MDERIGCLDGGCVFGPPTGMHTNGGCKCLDGIRDPRKRAAIRRALSGATQSLGAAAPTLPDPAWVATLIRERNEARRLHDRHCCTEQPCGASWAGVSASRSDTAHIAAVGKPGGDIEVTATFSASAKKRTPAVEYESEAALAPVVPLSPAPREPFVVGKFDCADVWAVLRESEARHHGSLAFMGSAVQCHAVADALNVVDGLLAPTPNNPEEK